MPLEQIELSALIPAAPDEVFEAWMSAKKHAAFTGAAARVEARAGSRHLAWEGYIHGWVLKVGPGRRATFAWRTTDFASHDIDSVVELTVRRAKGGSVVSLRHSDIPAGQGDRYTRGWDEFYFEPLRAHFEKKKKAVKKKG